MVWTVALDVDPGDYTKASDYDTLADNPEYLQTLADVDHDFHVSTGTGKHKTIQFLADSTYNVGSAAVRAATVFTDTLGDSGQALTCNSSAFKSPNHPYFMVYASADILNVTGDATVYGPVIFNTEVADQASNYNTTTGQFTAPVTGPYLFTLSIEVDGLAAGHTVLYARLITSNRSIYLFYLDPHNVISGGSIILSGSTFCDMDAADTASISVMASGATKVVDINSLSYFSGRLM